MSATLREKPLSMTPGRKDLASFIQGAGGIPPQSGDKPITTPVNGSEIHEDELHGLEEVNLLDSLSQGLVLS